MLLAATVRSFAHMPLGISDRKTIQRKTSGHPLFFRASAICSKIQNVKSILHTAKNFWATLFFKASARYSKLLNNKKYIFNTVNSGRPLFFTSSASCSKIQNVKSIFHTAKNFWATLFFSGSLGLYCGRLDTLKLN